MSIRMRSVVIKHLPAKLNGRECRTFFSDVERCMNVDRPSMVLDCSNVRVMDRSVVHLMLCCLEEAMKRNGDVRLAGISAQGEALLEQIGVNRLFDIYDTTLEAVNSFHQFSVENVLETMLPAGAQRQSESAA